MTRRALFEYVLRLGDTDVVLAQRLSEWVGHGPVIEEDIALTNVGPRPPRAGPHVADVRRRVEGR